MARRLQLALLFAAIAIAGSGCVVGSVGPDQHTQDSLRQRAIARLVPPPGSFRLGCDWYYHTEYSEVVCRVVVLVPRGTPSSEAVEWLVRSRAETSSADASVFGSWNGRDVVFSDIFLGVTDPAGGFDAYQFQCTDQAVFLELESDPKYVSAADRGSAGCQLVLNPTSDTFTPM